MAYRKYNKTHVVPGRQRVPNKYLLNEPLIPLLLTSFTLFWRTYMDAAMFSFSLPKSEMKMVARKTESCKLSCCFTTFYFIIWLSLLSMSTNTLDPTMSCLFINNNHNYRPVSKKKELILNLE